MSTIGSGDGESPTNTGSSPAPQTVAIVRLDIPFAALVWFLIKLLFAAIPTITIGAILGAIASAIIRSL